MNDNSLEEVQKIYSDVSEWLKFLEAKHAGLFAVWIAILCSVVSLDGLSNNGIKIKWAFIIMICMGIMINLISFFPFLNKSKTLKRACYRKYSDFSENAVFYQAIFVDTFCEDDINVSMDKYKNILDQRGIRIDNKLLIDYTRQIIEVSSVGTIKAYLFEFATKYAFFVILLTIIGLIIA